MQRFSFPGLPVRVIFGAGSVHTIGAEIDRLSGPAFMIHTPRNAELVDRLACDLDPPLAARFDSPRLHTPVPVTDAATAAFRGSGAACIVALGGGARSAWQRQSRCAPARRSLPSRQAMPGRK